jgi:DNA-binding transcriptional LysR family regulator
MLDPRRLRLLCDLAQLGTIAAVAKAHSYTPSAVSQQLAALEREAGVALLARTGRRVTLTSAGVVLVRHAEGVLAALEGASAAMATARTELSGPLRIGTFPTAVRPLLAPALVTLGRDHSKMELMVTELDPVAVPDSLRERRLDVALTNDYDVLPAQVDPMVDAVCLLSETVFLAVPTDLDLIVDLDRSTNPVTYVRHAAWIVASPNTVCHAVSERVCRAAGFTAQVRHYADDFDTVLALVAAGQGVSLVPQLAAAQPPANVRLIPLSTRRTTRIAYRRGTGAHPAVAACVTALRASTRDYLARQHVPGGQRL